MRILPQFGPVSKRGERLRLEAKWEQSQPRPNRWAAVLVRTAVWAIIKTWTRIEVSVSGVVRGEQGKSHPLGAGDRP
jgi:hypothetical protein